MMKTGRCCSFNTLKIRAIKYIEDVQDCKFSVIAPILIVVCILLIILIFYASLCSADELYIEGIDVNGESFFGYMEVDDTDIVDGFVKDLKGNIIFLEDESQNAVKEDAFGQVPGFEDDVDFFGQDYEINLEEE
ncbi:hypothetical protein KAU11_00355 [Candidatus Babeliales bacterium]|nr:hypothetical protein [Candidatus Babeliales bacterium]